MTGLQSLDLDGDARRDLIYAEGNTLSIRLGASDGGLVVGVDVTLDGGVSPFMVEDLNGDGQLDVVATNGSVLQVLVATRDGGFTRGQRTTARHFGFGLGHFNADRVPDLVVAYGYSFAILHNDGDAGFVERVRVDAGTDAFGIGVGDLDADGWSDLLLPRLSGTIGLLYGGPDGGFTPAPDLAYGALADFNGDGKPDVYGLERDGAGVMHFVFALNQGGRTFGPQQAVRTLPGARLHVGDLTGDGRPDVVAADDIEGLMVHVNEGAGQFRSVGPFFSQRPEYPALGDWNGDGVLDVAVVVASGYGIAVLPGLGDGRLVSPTIYEDRTSGWPAVLRDYDADGALDLVWAKGKTATSSGEVGVLRNDGAGLFTEWVTSTVFAEAASLGGFDLMEAGPGERPSLVALDSRGLLLVRSAGDGGFLPAERVQTGSALAKGPVFADFDGDGRTDVSWADEDVLRVLVNRDGGFGAALEHRVSGWPIRSYLVGRFNADSLPDLLVERTDYANRTWVLERANGDGTFSATWSWDAGPSLSGFLLGAPGDYDGDGLTEVWVVQADSAAWLLRSDGAGGVSWSSRDLGLTRRGELRAFRWPGAAQDSLAIRISTPASSSSSPSSHTLLLTDLNDAGTPTVRQRFVTAGGLWSWPEFGDLDRDGRLDFVLGDNVTRAVFLNVCGP